MVKQTKGRNKDGGIVKPADTPALDDRGRSYLRGDSKTARQKEGDGGREEAVMIRLLTKVEAFNQIGGLMMQADSDDFIPHFLNGIEWLYSHGYVIGRKR